VPSLSLDVCAEVFGDADSRRCANVVSTPIRRAAARVSDGPARGADPTDASDSLGDV
jgi:hypothetical protein